MRSTSSTKNNHRHCIERLKIELIILDVPTTYPPKMLLNATSKNIEGVFTLETAKKKMKLMNIAFIN